MYIVQIVTGLAGGIHLPQGREGCSKIRKKNTNESGHGIYRLVAKHQDFYTQCGMYESIFFLKPLVKDVSITCNPVWWSEVVPESRWCFVWSQTGHDQTVLPWSSWRASLLCGSRVKKQRAGGERLSCHPWQDGQRGEEGESPQLSGTRKIKAPSPNIPTCLLHSVHSLLLLVSYSENLSRFHKHKHKNKVTGKYCILISTVRYSGESGGNHCRSHKPSISGNRNGAKCHKGHVLHSCGLSECQIKDNRYALEMSRRTGTKEK